MSRLSSSGLGSLGNSHLGPKPFKPFPTGTPNAASARSRTSARPVGSPAPATRPEARPTCSKQNSRSTRPPLSALRPERFPWHTSGRGPAVARATVKLSAAHARRESPVDEPEKLIWKSRLCFFCELPLRNRRLPAVLAAGSKPRNWERMPEHF